MVLYASLGVLVAVTLGSEGLVAVWAGEDFEAQMGAYVVFDVTDLVELLAALQALEHAAVVACSLVDARLPHVVLGVVDLVARDFARHLSCGWEVKFELRLLNIQMVVI